MSNTTPSSSPEKTEKKEKKQNPWKRIIILVVILLLILLLTNPSLMFFLPASWREGMKSAYSGLFGDVDQITKVVRINWISLFKVVVIILLMMIIKGVLKLILEKIKPKTAKGASVISMLRSFNGYAIALIGLVWCLSAIGINLSTIFASIGIVALVIGFAAESLIEDVVTGLFLVFEDEFNVGDIIEYNGFRGTVTNIGVRVTSIQDPGGNIKLVNNSDLRNVLNRSRTQSNAVCDIPISYAADLAQTEEILKSIAAKMPEGVARQQIRDAVSAFIIGIPRHRLKALRRLRRRYRTYILSNTNPIMFEGVIAQNFGKEGLCLRNYFDGVTVSYQAHANKPSPEIFEYAINTMRITPEETLFIDDSQQNLETAKALGFETLLIEPGEEFAEVLTAMDMMP